MADDRNTSRTEITAWAAMATAVAALLALPFAYFEKTQEMDVKMVEIGMDILRAPPNADIAVMRDWAVDIIEKRSKQKFTADQRSALLHNQLPVHWDSPTQRDLDQAARESVLRDMLKKADPSARPPAPFDLPNPPNLLPSNPQPLAPARP